MFSVLKTRNRARSLSAIAHTHSLCPLLQALPVSDGISRSYLKTALPTLTPPLSFFSFWKIQKVLKGRTKVIALEIRVLLSLPSLGELMWQQSVCVPPSHSVVLNVSTVTGPQKWVMGAFLQLLTATLLWGWWNNVATFLFPNVDCLRMIKQWLCPPQYPHRDNEVTCLEDTVKGAYWIFF